MVELTQIEFLNGIFAIIIVIVFSFIALKLMVKYFKFKDIKLIYLGCAIPFLSTPWWAISTTFVFILATGSPISPEIYFLIGYGIPLGIILWLILFTELIYKERQKLILSIFTPFWILFFGVIFYMLLLTDVSLIGTFDRPLTPQMGLYLRIRSLVALIIVLVTGIIFYRESHKSINPEVKLKGTLFLLGILLYLGGTFTYVITQIAGLPLIFLIPSLIVIDGALTLPNWMRKILLKEK